ARVSSPPPIAATTSPAVEGRGIEPSDIAVEPLLPADPWSALELDAFWHRLPEVDAAFEQQRARAEAEGRRLRYLATYEAAEGGAARASVRLEAVGPEHPAFGLRGPDNLVAVTTERYRHYPLVIRGPGAGPEVTAAGVLADLLTAAG
ncbi:MAG: hypothetical protein MI919_06380, partial [Holophagales bacterium]|nr:hypothetical protein [Holophagales bacterium]